MALTKQFGATLSVVLNCFLILLKLIVGITSGSVAVMASAIDSLVDLVASVLAFVGIRLSDAPPDVDHPFGHSKFEDFAGFLEALLIIVGAVFIIWEAVDKFTNPKAALIDPIAGIIVMIVALVLDFAVSQLLFKIAKDTESPALYADAHHLSTDVWSNIAVIIGLGLVKLTGNPIFDPIMALVVAFLIVGVGFRIVKEVFNHLMDTALPEDEVRQIEDIVHQTMPAHEPVEVADLKTRRSGSHRLIVFNLRVSPHLTVQTAHQYCDAIEDAIEAQFANCTVNIHLEPLTTQPLAV